MRTRRSTRTGIEIASLRGYVSEYTDIELGAVALEALRPGENVIAVKCHQTRGGQSIDVGLVEIVETPR